MLSNMRTAKTFTALTVIGLLASCGKSDSNSPGVEYMPDMYRSPAIEAYVDYGQDPYYHTEDKARDQRNRPSARKPVEGTIAFSDVAEMAQFNMPYPYPNSPEGYEAAGVNLRSPIEMTQATVDHGKALYEKFCMHCHGATGQGDGPVVNNGNYPAPGSYTGPLRDLPEGKIFHVLVYGKNVAMGSHASQLNKEERWMVTHYVQYLQNGGMMTREPAAAAPATTASN